MNKLLSLDKLDRKAPSNGNDETQLSDEADHKKVIKLSSNWQKFTRSNFNTWIYDNCQP